jgi:NADPH:quinone reductase-like Zn-dependent oxidoreductase
MRERNQDRQCASTGGAGNVGAYAVQLARQAGLQVFATAASDDLEYVRNLGAERVVNYKTTKFEDAVSQLMW